MESPTACTEYNPRPVHQATRARKHPFRPFLNPSFFPLTEVDTDLRCVSAKERWMQLRGCCSLFASIDKHQIYGSGCMDDLEVRTIRLDAVCLCRTLRTYHKSIALNTGYLSCSSRRVSFSFFMDGVMFNMLCSSLLPRDCMSEIRRPVTADKSRMQDLLSAEHALVFEIQNTRRSIY